MKSHLVARMDRGAARSRKRAVQIEMQSQGRTVTRPEPGPSRLPSSPRRWKPLPQARARLQNETSPVDPDQYKPKAIRTSVALIYNEAPFSIPPSSDLLAKVRRVDLAGSGCTDVSWLEGSGATWLSLAGCRVEKGWDAVGGLSELSGATPSP